MPAHQNAVENLVAILAATLLPGRGQGRVQPWRWRPLTVGDLATAKLVGLSKQAGIHKSVEKHVSIFDYEAQGKRLCPSPILNTRQVVCLGLSLCVGLAMSCVLVMECGAHAWISQPSPANAPRLRQISMRRRTAPGTFSKKCFPTKSTGPYVALPTACV